jgi:hypothetical protein
MRCIEPGHRALVAIHASVGGVAELGSLGQMNLRIFVTIFLFVLASCKSGIGPHERLGWYGPYVPQRLIIERFYETPGPSMDHEYMWKIKTDGSEEFSRFWQQFSSTPPNADGVNNYDSVAIFASHPEWWKEIDFKKGVLFKYRVSVIGSGGAEKADVFVLFDKDAGYVYI